MVKEIEEIKNDFSGKLMNNFCRYIGLLCVMITTLTACSKYQNETEIVLLLSSDVRGNFMGYNYLEDAQYHYGLASFATLVKEQRALYGDRLLVLDAGERHMNSPLWMYTQLVDTVGELSHYAMERSIGYDVIGLGMGERQESELLDPKRHNPFKQAPIVCANVVNRETGLPVFRPYIMLERAGIKIAVMGFCDRMQNRWVQDEAWANTTDRDVCQSIRQWMPEVMKQNPDVIVGLFHMIEITPEMAAPFDVILTSRSRAAFTTTVSPWEGHYVPVVGAGRYASYAGLVKIHLLKRRQVGKGEPRYDKLVSTSIVDMDDFEQDDTFVSKWKSYNDSLKAWVNRPLSYLNEDLTVNEGLFACDKYRRFIHNAQLQWTGADISMATCLVPNTTFKAGPVSMHTIYGLYPHDNQLITLKMTLDEVRKFLEYGYAQQFGTISKMQKTTDPLLYRYDKKGHLMYSENGEPRLYTSPKNYTSAAGIIYDVDLTKPVGKRVSIKGFEDGREMDVEAFYNVCVNSYQSGNEFIKIGLQWDEEMLAARTVPAPSHNLRHILYEQLRQMDTIRIDSTVNWHVVPSNLLDLGRIAKTYHAAW